MVCGGDCGRAKTIIRLNERINGEIIPLFWPSFHPREREGRRGRERERAALSEALFTFLLPFLMAKIDGGAAMMAGVYHFSAYRTEMTVLPCYMTVFTDKDDPADTHCIARKGSKCSNTELRKSLCKSC